MEYEYRDREFEMWLEVTSDSEPNEKEIIKHAKDKGYMLKNIEIWLDHFQNVWRGRADLLKLYN